MELGTVEVRLRWDPSPLGRPPHHLDIVAAVCGVEDPYGRPRYVVHADSRSPDGTITMKRHSSTGRGLGFDEVMVLEFDRMAPGVARVVVGVVIHQGGGWTPFGEVARTAVSVVENYRELLRDDFARVGASTASTSAEFTRSAEGPAWEVHALVRGFDADPVEFAGLMSTVRPS